MSPECLYLLQCQQLCCSDSPWLEVWGSRGSLFVSFCHRTSKLYSQSQSNLHCHQLVSQSQRYREKLNVSGQLWGWRGEGGNSRREKESCIPPINTKTYPVATNFLVPPTNADLIAILGYSVQQKLLFFRQQGLSSVSLSDFNSQCVLVWLCNSFHKLCRL